MLRRPCYITMLYYMLCSKVVYNMLYNMSVIWKNDRLGKSGYPGISQYKFSKMGYPTDIPR